MEAGKLRKRVTFLSPVNTRNSSGEVIQTWTPTYSCWASIDQLRGANLTLAQGKTETSIATHQITIRYNGNVNETMRIQYGGPPVYSPTPVSFSTMTMDDLVDLTINPTTPAAPTQTTPPPTTYTINWIMDAQTSHKMMVIIATVEKA